MQQTIDETNRRREKQLLYNEKMGITPRQIIRRQGSIMKELSKKGVAMKAYVEPEKPDIAADPVVKFMSREALEKSMEKTRKAMEKAASELNFIEAARLRDEINGLQKLLSDKQKI